jgi:hypothetical protein
VLEGKCPEEPHKYYQIVEAVCPGPPRVVIRGWDCVICDGQGNLSNNHLFLPWSPAYLNQVSEPQLWKIKKGSSSLCIAIAASSSASSNTWEVINLQQGPYQDCQACDFMGGWIP